MRFKTRHGLEIYFYQPSPFGRTCMYDRNVTHSNSMNMKNPNMNYECNNHVTSMLKQREGQIGDIYHNHLNGFYKIIEEIKINLKTGKRK